MREQKNTRLRLNYAGKGYTIDVDCSTYAEELIVNKLKIGHANYWLVFQNSTWRFIGEMPLCREIKNIIVRKIAAWHQFPAGTESALVTGQESVRTGILLNALLYVMAIKKQIP